MKAKDRQPVSSEQSARIARAEFVKQSKKGNPQKQTVRRNFSWLLFQEIGTARVGP